MKSLSNQGSVEIMSLSLPDSSNNYMAVSMYCDRNGIAKKLPINERATSIARSCNHDMTVYGDVFIGRCHDDESLPWERVDFTLDDLNSDSTWIAEARRKNKGKPTSNFSTSGTIENILKQQSNTNKSVPIDSSATTIGNSSWSQTSDEIEWRVFLADFVKKTDIIVSIRSNRVKLSSRLSDSQGIWKNLESLSSLDSQLIQSEGAELWANIDVDSSTWTLGKDHQVGNVLCLSLCKQDSGVTWKHLLKKE
mmetsp:Transcript_32369/g.44352  ORF Transcript_32369/g.44352 Transcript_32369/m.44352 type:complete len:251 (-) Transcript_32369:42-794(-)